MARRCIMNSIKLSEIVWDPKIYPRDKWNTGIIKEYTDVIKSGKDFDKPIILEKGTNRLLDGKHRVSAYQEYKTMFDEAKESSEFKPEEWADPKDEILVEYHDVPENIPAYIYALSLSSKHGCRIAPADKKANARRAFEENPDYNIKTIAEYVGVSNKTLSNYVKDLLFKREEEQRFIAYHQFLLGWTQEEIGESIGITHSAVAQKFLLANGKNEKLPIPNKKSPSGLPANSEFGMLEITVKEQLESGVPHLTVAERNNMPLILVHAIDLMGREDQTKLGRMNINIQPYDVWNFAKCDDLFGDQHPGRIPGQLIAHVLYFFTKPGDVVFDPMSGSGTTQDVSLAMGRKCYAFDIDPRHERHDIILHNIGKDGWHDRIKKADLLFWDPPYFEKMDKSNIGKDGYVDESISGYSREEYLDFFTKSLSEAKKAMKKGAKLAFLMSDWDDETNERKGIFIWDYADIIRKAGWNLVRQIQTPLSTQQVHPDIVNKFRKSRRLARLERYLLIAEVK
jgi:DNA modification methylase